MTSKKQRRGLTAATVAALAIIMVAAGGFDAWAQQRQFNPEPAVPQTQKQGGSVLELVPRNSHQTGTVPSLPQIAPQPQELTVPSHELRNQAGYQQVTVTVTDQQGRYVTGLQKSDFNLSVDGQQRPIEFFRQDLNTPVSIGILVDTSGSMEPKLTMARAAIAGFIHELNDRDDVFMFAFSSRPYLLQPFTTDHNLVMGKLALLHAYGQTSLFDTIIDGLLMVQHGRYDKKALLVVTDGMDNTSQSGLEQVVAEARRMGVLIYSIGIGDPNASSMPSLAIGPFMIGTDIDQVDARTLKMLSTESGARTVLVREVGDGRLLQEDCAAISRELREQYTVGFITPDAARGGYRNVHVDVPGHAEDSVRVRKGVMVGSTESASADPGG
jgi:Ca-activated chloride channel family protein